jgi:hypothetical protein
MAAEEEVCMLRLLKFLLGGVGGFFGNLFGFLGNIFEFAAKLPMAALETFGFVQPVPQQLAAEEAEEAAAQSRQQHSGSALRKTNVTWTPEQKLAQIGRWCDWRIGIDTGPEPSLAGLTTSEKLKLKAADELTLKALTRRTLPQVERWMHSPKRALTPLMRNELERVQQSLEMENQKSADTIACWRSISDRYDVGGDAFCSAATIDTDADDVIRLAEEALSYRPAGPAFA